MRRTPGSPTARRRRRSRRPSAVLGVELAGVRDLFFVAVADGEQHRLGVVEIAPLLAVVFERTRLHDGIDRAALLAKAAEDALREVDVVACGAPRAVGALLGLDRDGERRTHRFTQLAGDAALLAIRIAPQRMQSAEAHALRCLLLGEEHRHLAREHVPSGERETLAELQQEPGVEELSNAVEHRPTLLVKQIRPAGL